MLEEKRDDIVMLLIRKMQGALFGRLKRRVYNKKKDQRLELFSKMSFRWAHALLSFFQGDDSSRPEKLPQVHCAQGLAVVCHNTEDQAVDWLAKSRGGAESLGGESHQGLWLVHGATRHQGPTGGGEHIPLRRARSDEATDIRGAG